MAPKYVQTTNLNYVTMFYELVLHHMIFTKKNNANTTNLVANKQCDSIVPLFLIIAMMSHKEYSAQRSFKYRAPHMIHDIILKTNRTVHRLHDLLRIVNKHN